MYGKGRAGMNVNGPVPVGYNDDKVAGRPKERASIIGTQDDPLGKDRLGRIANNTTSTPNETGEGTPKGGSPLALTELKRNQNLLKGIKVERKNLVFENIQESSLLDEKNIKDI
jgi:hypothetical protein